MLLLLLQAIGPNDCILSGLCGAGPVQAGLPSGVMFTAVGLVVLGLIGIRNLRRT